MTGGSPDWCNALRHDSSPDLSERCSRIESWKEVDLSKAIDKKKIRALLITCNFRECQVPYHKPMKQGS